MELIGSLLLILAVGVVVALFVLQPFLRRGTAAPQGGEGSEKQLDHQRSALLAERDRVLTALQELDFDNALGKVPADDFREQRASLLKTGADALRRLDEMNSGAAQAGEREGKPVEERIEAAVAARRADSYPAGIIPAAQLDGAPVAVGNGGGNGKGRDELEELIASRKRQRKESAAGFCPRCGRPVQKSDKFCSRCGETI